MASLKVATEDFLGTVLQRAAQPICVGDTDGRIRFANAAALAALGYDTVDDAPMRLPPATGRTVTSDLDWFVRRDGSKFPVSYVSVPIDTPTGRLAVVTFTDAEDRLREEGLRREQETILVAQRRIATLVAGGAPPEEVFAAIAEQVGDVIGLPLVVVWRYESEGVGVVIGAWGELRHQFQPGSRWSLDGGAVCAMLRRVGRARRVDDLEGVPGTIADAQREAGLRSCAGAPIIVDGEVWGAISVLSTDPARLPDQIENRLAGITELVATAISSSTSREELAWLADEQAALRRVATLVARGVPEGDLFGAVIGEVGSLFGADLAGMIRYGPDLAVTPVAAWGAAGEHPVWPDPWPTDEVDPATMIAKTRRAERIDWSGVTGTNATLLRGVGIRSSVGSPIVVDGRLWGALAVHTKRPHPFPPDTESRLENFTELVATAISNIEARAALTASRARIAEATDEERRRVVRDLHDGAQQRLVHTIITLKLARRAWQSEEEDLPALLTEALDQAEQANVELRELAHGILPASLTHGGLRMGVDGLASRMPVPVEKCVSVGRLPAAVEATAYFVVAEALTNVAKHARARRATVAAHVEDGTLRVQVRDDGIGGARPDGSGLLGMADRLAALGGQLRIESPAGGGTLIAADFPLTGY
ncbi:GAF domain-containing sensor histidine kinase [Candidatus Solirubrobacter pratensis]|uniref:GAF domain-containing sensor histidine kinase n=1 Tax=Candidatus Solirubrobacter pratensis TaxID=1298857 RepID=UPI00041B45FD|nr:GAF domain-containing protein [Candidatus Solirubrobacter pratensis]